MDTPAFTVICDNSFENLDWYDNSSSDKILLFRIVELNEDYVMFYTMQYLPQSEAKLLTGYDYHDSAILFFL